MKRALFLAGSLLLGAHAARAEGVVAGKAAETMNSGGYTYVRVQDGKDSSWVAIPQQAVKVGDPVSYSRGAEMTDFHSKTLNRTFKKLIFSEGPAGAGHGGKALKAAPAHGAPATGRLSVKVARAEGADAYTVAEIFARRKELDGKQVSVRGKVVKVSEAIMDRNWVHLQDGSGDPKAGTHDIVITTSETAKAGETVTARGTAAEDKDFGSGYRYQVIIEKGALKR
ncbi:MAG: DNA-binding protein [Elusimicrobia bacterium]|nr:DNA-binding protein [Elusimicrobiota bacterium]